MHGKSSGENLCKIGAIVGIGRRMWEAPNPFFVHRLSYTLLMYVCIIVCCQSIFKFHVGKFGPLCHTFERPDKKIECICIRSSSSRGSFTWPDFERTLGIWSECMGLSGCWNYLYITPSYIYTDRLPFDDPDWISRFNSTPVWPFEAKFPVHERLLFVSPER